MGLRDALTPGARAALQVLQRVVRPSRRPVPVLGAQEEDVLAFLRATGLGGAFHLALESGALDDPSPSLRSNVASLYWAAFGPNMARFDELARLNRELAGRGLEVIPLKGVVVAARIFHDLGARSMSDVDVLVREPHIAPVAEVLRSLGYRDMPMPLDPFVGTFGRHVPPLYHGGKKVTFELHRAVDYRFSFLPGPPDFFRAAVPVTVDGRPLLVPSWEDFLYQWAVHAAYTDAWTGKLRDCFDLACLMERLDGLPAWETLAPYGTYVFRPLWMGLTAAGGLFDSPACREAAEAVRSRARPGVPFRRLADRLLEANLVSGRLARRWPLSVLSAVSFLAHCPEHWTGFLGDFLRQFLFPPGHRLRAQYGRDRSLLALRLWRPLHVAGTIVQRLWSKGPFGLLRGARGTGQGARE